MKLLPSERKIRLAKAKTLFIEKETITIVEPCNCGRHIQHNNGGNYHMVIELVKDEDKVYIREGSTYEHDNPKWEVCHSWENVVEEYSDWL